jgi:hypothetical protein
MHMALQVRSRSWNVAARPDLRVDLRPAPDRKLPGRVRLVLASPWLTGAVTLLSLLGFVLARWQKWAQGHVGSFILVGSRFVADPGQIASGVPVMRPSTGYDGQFYYRLALDPANLHQTAFGITMDAPYRFMRIGYPVLAWLASAGQRAAVPVALVAVNVAAMAALGYLGGVVARDGGRHALWGLLVPAFSGLLTSVARDTAEPVACALLLAGLIAYRRGRPVLAGVLLAWGALTRETAMVAVLAIALVRLRSAVRSRRPARADLAWLIPVTAFGAWELVVYLITGQLALGADGGRNAGLPLLAPADAVWENLRNATLAPLSWADIWLVELGTLLAVAGAALACWRRSRAGRHERLALAGYLAEILIVTPSTWDSLNADLRSFAEVYLLGIVVLLGVPPSRGRLRWLLPAAAVCVAPALLITAGRRILWS